MSATPTSRMCAGVLAAPGRFRLDQVPIPDPGPREVRVRIEGSGVCGSNLAVWEGKPWFRYPLEPGMPGHEGWGEVDALGSAVTELAPGDRVAVLSPKAFAERAVVSLDELVRIPAALSGYFPGEALGCAVNVLRRSRIEAGQVVGVVGIGFLGVVLTRLATLAGARVLALSRRGYALEIARRFGAVETVGLDEPDPVARIHELTGGALCDRVIEAVGLQSSLDVASRLVRERGTLVIAGYHQDGPRTVDLQLWNWRGLDVVNAHERDPAVYREGIRQAAELVASGDLDPAPLYTHTVGLDRLGDAFDLLARRPPSFLKALVTT